MLAMRLQRTGRSGHTQFRVIVQDSRFSPTRGRVVAYLGSYDPHTKTASLDSQKASQYLDNGAQPSDRVARLLQKEGIKLPSWVKLEAPQTGKIRNPDKRRSTRPAEPEAPVSETEAAPPTEESATSEAPEETTEPSEPAPESPTVEEPAIPEAPTEPAAEATPTEETDS
ncbi:30S ribosomal protein S16 [Candidatus Saccharibacteria bacterium]|nr:30S ribosomal protein S16 [Candidatus Saccharibacteria bacterium]